MIKVYEVSRKYIMLFMSNNRYWVTYFVAVNYTACLTITQSVTKWVLVKC